MTLHHQVPWNVRHKALLGGPEIYKEGAGEDRGAVFLRHPVALGAVCIHYILEENSRHLREHFERQRKGKTVLRDNV